MIPQAHINAWREHAPWRRPVQVEQDLIISRALVEIFNHPELAGSLVLRGGTALHKLCFQSPKRYSEDIDLVQIQAGPIGPVFDALRVVLTPFLGKPQRKQGPGVVTLIYRITSEGAPALPMKLKVEINTREHFSVLRVQRKAFAVSSPWFEGKTNIPVYDLNELLGTKLRALYQRRKGRDLFDLWIALTKGGAVAETLVAVFKRYMEISGVKVSQAEFARNLEQKKADPGFVADISDLLPVGDQFEFPEGFAVVEKEILPRL